MSLELASVGVEDYKSENVNKNLEVWTYKRVRLAAKELVASCLTA